MVLCSNEIGNDAQDKAVLQTHKFAKFQLSGLEDFCLTKGVCCRVGKVSQRICGPKDLQLECHTADVNAENVSESNAPCGWFCRRPLLSY